MHDANGSVVNTITLYRKLVFCGLLAVAAQLSSPAEAASYTWNELASGYWNTSSLNWSSNGSAVAWNNGNEAVFASGSNGSFWVKLEAGPTATNLIFTRSTHILSAAKARTLTLSATNSTLVVNPGATVTFGNNVTVATPSFSRNAVISGGGTLNFDAGSMLDFKGAGTANFLSIDTATVNLNAGAELKTAMVSGSTGSALFVNGQLNVNGGVADIYGTLGIGQTDLSGGGTLTVNSGTVTANSNSGIRFGAANGTGQGGTVNLNGGTLRVSKFLGRAGSSVVNLNGGTLMATLASSAFISGLDRVNVRDGGAKIDSDGKDITLAQGLLHSNIGNDAGLDGGLTKSGSGTLKISAASTYTGPTVVNGGRLVLAATNSTSALSVSEGAEIRVLNAAGPMPATPVRIAGTFGSERSQLGAVTLASTGRLEAGTVGGGLVSPSFASFSGTSGAVLSLQLGKKTPGTDPTANTDYERITVRKGGSVQLNGMTLDLQPTANTANIKVDDLFFIVYNQGADPVQGTFAGLEQDAEFEWQNKRFRISYTAHFGGNYLTSKMIGSNDVALLAVAAPVANTWAPTSSFQEVTVGQKDAYTAFGVYNACPESPDGKRILFIRFKTPPIGDASARNQPAELWICNRDLTGYRKIKDLEANADNHNGAFVQWLDNDSIAYSGYQVGNGAVCVINADTGKTEFGPYQGACVGDNTFGTQFLMNVRSRSSNVGPQGLYWVDGATGSVRLIFRNTDFASYAAKFKATTGPEDWYFTHPHISTDGSHIFFKIAAPRDQFLFLCRLDGSELVYWGPNKPMHTHFYDEDTIWGSDNIVPDGTLNNLHFKRWRSDKKYLGTLAGIGCHTAMSPDKKWFLGESWYGSNPVVLRLYAAGETTPRAELFSSPYVEMIWEYRGHVNPSFSRDGKRAYYNRAVSNSLKQATMVDISSIVDPGQSSSCQ